MGAVAIGAPAVAVFRWPDSRLTVAAAVCCQDSDALSEFSMVEDFPQIHSGGRRGSRAASAAGSRRGQR